MPNLNAKDGYGGRLNADTPTQVEKSSLDHVTFVAAGKYHSMAITKAMAKMDCE